MKFEHDCTNYRSAKYRANYFGVAIRVTGNDVSTTDTRCDAMRQSADARLPRKTRSCRGFFTMQEDGDVKRGYFRDHDGSARRSRPGIRLIYGGDNAVHGSETSTFRCAYANVLRGAYRWSMIGKDCGVISFVTRVTRVSNVRRSALIPLSLSNYLGAS